MPNPENPTPSPTTSSSPQSSQSNNAAFSWKRMVEQTPLAGVLMLVHFVFIQPMQLKQESIEKEMKSIRQSVVDEIKGIRDTLTTISGEKLTRYDARISTTEAKIDNLFSRIANQEQAFNKHIQNPKIHESGINLLSQRIKILEETIRELKSKLAANNEQESSVFERMDIDRIGDFVWSWYMGFLRPRLQVGVAEVTR